MKTLIKKLKTERELDLFIGNLLRWGVVLACAITLFGGVIYLYQHHGASMAHYKPIPDGQPFPGVEHYLRELGTLLPRMFAFDGAAIIQFGVCVLIATPILRVGCSIVGFLIEKDYLYVAITALVLCIILANMLLGLH